jgi:hypothetical protein
MRKSSVYLTGMAMSGMVLLGLVFHASYEQRREAPRLEKTASLVRQYRLTDLSLFTEARYTRNPSMADLNTAFQDYPFSFDHFPSGSLVPVPSVVKK